MHPTGHARCYCFAGRHAGGTCAYRWRYEVRRGCVMMSVVELDVCGGVGSCGMLLDLKSR